MKYVTRDLKIIYIRNYVGDCEDTDTGLKTELALTMGLNEPIITFSDGTEVIISWGDLVDIATEYKKSQDSKSENLLKGMK